MNLRDKKGNDGWSNGADWVMGPGKLFPVPRPRNYPALHVSPDGNLRAHGPAYYKDNPRDFELICPCLYCGTERLHHLRDIRKVIDTDAHETPNDDGRTWSTRYRGIKYRLIKRECMECRQPWEELLDKEYGTWDEVENGDE